MNIQEPKNRNYAACVVKLQTFVDLPNCDNVKAAIIFGNSVIVGKDAQVGDIGLFFPVETQLSPEFLSNNNLYRPVELNVDPTKKGYFETHGRIKAVKFRGNKSEGFFVPMDFLTYIPECGDPFSIPLGTEFDTIGDHEICQKYVAKQNAPGVQRNQGKKPKPEDNIVEGQFKFHIDTAQLRRNIHVFELDDIISITDKWHGTSGIVSNVLIKRDIPWYEKFLTNCGIKIIHSEYGMIHASRRVIKGVGEREKDGEHFYNSNIWGIVEKEISDRIPKCYTVYFEIVGYTPEGKAIQSAPGGKKYSYECEIGTHRVMIYRINITNPDGKVLELDLPQRLEFCKKYGFEHVKDFYYGTISNFLIEYVSTLPPNWSEEFLAILETKYVSRNCPYNPGLPAEGIVVRREKLESCDSYKLKNYSFLELSSKQLDEGIFDMEEQESLPY